MAKITATGAPEKITPEQAKEILEKGAPNRPLQAGRVEDMALQMLEGNWKLAQPISFDKKGALIDGQHRLAAVVEAGKPVWFMVQRGLEPDTFGVFDQGRLRTAADLHHLMGGTNSTRSCSVAYSMILRSTKGSKETRPNRKGVAEYALAHRPAIDLVIAHLDRLKYVTSGEMGAFANAHEKYGDKIAPMLQRIKDNTFQGRNDPMNTLVRWMLKHHTKDKVSKLRAPRELCYSAAVLAIKASLEKRELTVLKPDGQDF